MAKEKNNIMKFFKPTIVKIIIFLFVLLAFLFLPIIKVDRQCLIAPCGPIYKGLYSLTSDFYISRLGNFLYAIAYSIWPYNSIKIESILFNLSLIIILYIISCLILFLYNKIKAKI